MEMTLNQIAELTKRTINTVRQDVKRGRLVKSGRARIDTNDATNAAYLARYAQDKFSDVAPIIDAPIKKTRPQKVKPKPKPKPKPNPTAENLEPPPPPPPTMATVDVEIEQAMQDAKELDAMGEQELKEQLLREKIIMADLEREYKKKQTRLSEVRAKKMEGELIEVEWIIATLGHGFRMFKKELLQNVETILKTVISEHGIEGEDRKRYLEQLRVSLATTETNYQRDFKKTVEAYSPDKINMME